MSRAGGSAACFAMEYCLFGNIGAQLAAFFYFRLLIPIGKCYTENTFCRFKLWLGWASLYESYLRLK